MTQEKSSKSGLKRVFDILFKGLVFVPIILVTCLILFSPKFAPKTAQFDAQKWKSAQASRLPMARILISRATLNGISKEQMFSQLGDGVEVKASSSSTDASSTEYDYPMADDSGSGHKEGNNAYLKVQVVKDHVAKAWIVTGDSKTTTEPE